MRWISVSAVACLVFCFIACSPASSQTEIRHGRWREVNLAGFPGLSMTQQPTTYQCINTDLSALVIANSNCTSATGFQRTAEGVVYDGVCAGRRAGGGFRLHMLVSGDMQNHFVANATMMFTDGTGRGVQMHVEGEYEGACHGDE